MRWTKKDLTQFKDDITMLLGDDLPKGSDEEIFREMIYNVAALRSAQLDSLDARLLNTAFKELRYAMQVFKPLRSIPKAAVFGSARTRGTHAHYKQAEEFGRKLVKKGWMIITGGASGIMEAAMVGAGADKSIGLNIMLPFEQEPNFVIRGTANLMNFKYFFTRKLMFLKESAATVLFPGGYGTFDEGFESFTLVQTGKAKPRPLALVDAPGSDYWRSLTRYLKRHLEEEKLISAGDLTLMRHFQDTDAAIGELLHFYKNFVSSRFLKEKYLIRSKRPVSDDELKKMSKLFSDICVSGGIERMKSIDEDNDKDPTLERLVFHFNRSSYSRLRQLIDHLNDLPALT